MHTAARKRHPELIALFADLKADLNLPDADGMTPLQHAVMRNHVPTVKMLLERGADIEKKNKEGYSPLALALPKRSSRWRRCCSKRAPTSTRRPAPRH